MVTIKGEIVTLLKTCTPHLNPVTMQWCATADSPQLKRGSPLPNVVFSDDMTVMGVFAPKSSSVTNPGFLPLRTNC